MIKISAALGLLFATSGGAFADFSGPYSTTPASPGLLTGYNALDPQWGTALCSGNPCAVGTGGDDSAPINAAIAAASANPAAGGEIFFPTTPSGYYNLCANSITIPGASEAITLAGVSSASSGGSKIRILPGCASPPSAVLSIPSAFWGRLSIEHLTLDGYCLATNVINDQHSVGLQAHQSVFRNAATSGATVSILSGYENKLDGTDRIENINDYGHICYASASALPSYGLYMHGSDSQFDGLIVVGASIAGFYADNGGGNSFNTSHSWGYIADPVIAANGGGNVSMQSQYGFLLYGGQFLTDWKVDDPTVAAIKLYGFAATGLAHAIVQAGYLNNSTNNGAYGVEIASGASDLIVVDNDVTSAISAANAVVQDGTAGSNVYVFNNLGASYTSGSPWPVSYQSPLVLSGSALTFSWPSSAPISTIAPAGAVVSINVPSPAPFYATTYTPAAWNGALPTATIAAPPLGGSQAGVSIVSMDYESPGAIVSGGTGYVVNDVLTLSGGALAPGANAAQLKVTAVSSGVATAVAWTGTTPIRYTAFPTDTTSVSWTGGSGSGLTTHGIIFCPCASAEYSVTVPGSGYTSTPSVTLAKSGGTYPTSAANLTNNLTLSAASGYLLMNSTGTELGVGGMSGAPIVNQSAVVDATGVREPLTTSGYTVPVNVDLVRLVQTSTVASATITLPLAFADGQPIQFVNYSGAITALTLSPTVAGWTNGSTLAANTGLRIRWDGTAAAWQREE